jgi:hypothetical protein
LPGQLARFASGRAEWDITFSQKFGSQSQIFVKKIKKDHAAARRNTPLSSANGPFERAPRKSCQITGLTRSVPNQASAWKNGPIRLRQGGMEHSFSGTFGSPSQMFRKKIKSTMLPQAILPFTG